MRWQTRIILAGIAVIAVYVGLALFADARQLHRIWTSGFRRRWLAAAMGLGLCAFIVRSFRWRVYLHRLGVLTGRDGRKLRFATAFSMGLTSGKGGQVVKAYYLRLAAGLPYETSIPATIGERIADTYSLILLLILALLLGARGNVGLATLVVALTVIVTLFLRSELAPRAFKKLPYLRKHPAIVDRGHDALVTHLTITELAGPVAIGLVAFLLEGLALMALSWRGLGIPMDYDVAILLIAIIDLVSLLAVIPSGIGVAEGGLVFLLTLRGYSLPNAAVLTLLYRASTLWLGALIGGAAAGFLHLSHRKAERSEASPAR